MYFRVFASICMLSAGLGCTRKTTPAAPATAAATQETRNVTVIIETSMGSITAELDADKAPLSVSNFLAYADQQFYDGTIFHRVIPGFMAQGGGFTADMNQKPTQKPVKNEAGNGLKNTRGTLAMARTSVVDSATAQFFINLVDNAFLNHSAPTQQGFGYAVFGKVVAGMDVVDQIAKVPTGNNGPFQNVPATPVTILSVRRQAAASPAK